MLSLTRNCAPISPPLEAGCLPKGNSQVRYAFHAGSVFGDGPVNRLIGRQRARWWFAVIELFGLDAAIVRVARALLRCLSYDGHCRPSYARIAELAGCGTTTVYTDIRRLREAGLLWWETRKVRVDEERVRQNSNGYCLVMPDAVEPPSPAPVEEPVEDIVVEAAPLPASPSPQQPAPLVSDSAEQAPHEPESGAVVNKEQILSLLVPRSFTTVAAPQLPSVNSAPKLPRAKAARDPDDAQAAAAVARARQQALARGSTRSTSLSSLK